LNKEPKKLLRRTGTGFVGGTGVLALNPVALPSSPDTTSPSISNASLSFCLVRGDFKILLRTGEDSLQMYLIVFLVKI
jgi:hypothetical protein